MPWIERSPAFPFFLFVIRLNQVFHPRKGAEMSHGHNKHHAREQRHPEKSREQFRESLFHNPPSTAARPKLEIVLKCESAGSVDAATEAVRGIESPEVDILIIKSGIGMVSKSDVVMAETGSGLVVGFEVDVVPELKREFRDHHVEIRLYDVIYRMKDDLAEIARSLAPAESGDQILGTAKVIALFPGSRRGIIMGCEVLNGYLSVGARFRIISAMGPVYSGTFESIHIEKDAVNKATKGQKCGVKLKDFNKVKTGDLVESYRPHTVKTAPWKPQGGIISRKSA